jgi:hypothetical protein
MLVNVAEDAVERDHELKATLTLPTSEEIATSRMRTFAAYVRRLGESHRLEASRPKRSNAASTPSRALSGSTRDFGSLCLVALAPATAQPTSDPEPVTLDLLDAVSTVFCEVVWRRLCFRQKRA